MRLLRPLQIVRHLKDAKVSFSQYGEDLILDALTGYKRTGFYVDVGCNHPTNISNSYRFYLRGWSGVAIDANDEFSKDWKSMRPRDKFVAACVSDQEREVAFTVFKNRALSSVGGRRFYDNEQHYSVSSVKRMQTRPLTDILESTHAPNVSTSYPSTPRATTSRF